MNPASDNVAVPHANATSYSCRRQETESLIHEWGQRRITGVVLSFGHWSLVVLRTKFQSLFLALALRVKSLVVSLALIEGQVFDSGFGLEVKSLALKVKSLILALAWKVKSLVLSLALKVKSMFLSLPRGSAVLRITKTNSHFILRKVLPTVFCECDI